jgi:transposase-like protein
MQRNQHSNEFKEQALSKVRARGSRTLQSMATELNMSLGTLKGWLKHSGLEGAGLLRGEGQEMTLPGDVPARLWSPLQRLLALQESHALSGPALHAWCREKGLFEHRLVQWRDAFCAPAQTPAGYAASAANTALRELQARHAQLQREMLRKDRALAEAAALLVLQKKFQALVLQQSEGEDK